MFLLVVKVNFSLCFKIFSQCCRNSAVFSLIPLLQVAPLHEIGVLHHAYIGWLIAALRQFEIERSSLFLDLKTQVIYTT